MEDAMNSRERVHAALRRQPTDRVPIYMWFHPDTARRLGELLEIPASDVADVMGDDIHQIWVNNNYAMEGIVHAHDGERHQDDWGIIWERRFGFNQIVHFPLQGAPPEQVLAYRFPEERLEQLLAPMQALAEANARPDADNRYFLGCDVSPCVFEMYWRLRGMEDALLDMAAAPDLTRTMFQRCADFAIRLAEAACARFDLDWLWTGDDVASQQALIFSPATWRALIKPELARVFAVGKRYGLPIAYHCCGALRPIIPDLIEIGMDVLNPVQSACPGMDPLSLKREFGRQIAFMGGVDTQSLLPRGSEIEVRRATARLIEGMTADGGGYILAASHSIPPETPVANIFALYAEAGVTREEIFDRAAALRARMTSPPAE
jgi:uroporphyrinogen decarboxylase